MFIPVKPFPGVVVSVIVSRVVGRRLDPRRIKPKTIQFVLATFLHTALKGKSKQTMVGSESR